MKGNNNNKSKLPRRRRRNNNGSTVARNQTKYHRQYVGFETTFSLTPNTGIAMPIAPGNYFTPGNVPTSAYSQFFSARFLPIWKGWRSLGWRCTMIVTSKADAASDYAGAVAAVSFNQSLSPNSGPTTLLNQLKPNFITQLCEMPNVKMLSVNPANSKNRASFSYYQGRRDINSLPFQYVGDDIPYQYITGLQIFYESQPTDDTIFIRMFGNLLIEFKDPAFYIPAQIPEPIQQDDDDQHVPVARLRRTQLAN